MVVGGGVVLGKTCQSNLGKGQDRLVGWTLLDPVEVWAKRFKQREGINIHFLLDPEHGCVVWGLQDIFSPGTHAANGSAGSPCCYWEQAKPTGWLCCSHVWFLKDSIFKWEKELWAQLGIVRQKVTEFSSGSSGGNGLWGRSLPTSKIMQLFNKRPLSISQLTSVSGICLSVVVGSQTPLLFGNSIIHKCSGSRENGQKSALFPISVPIKIILLQRNGYQKDFVKQKCSSVLHFSRYIHSMGFKAFTDKFRIIVFQTNLIL